MHLALLEIESGLALAAVYALLSVSVTFTYRVTDMVQIAQGDIMMCGAYAGYFVGIHRASLPLVALAGATMAALLGLFSYHGVFRWLLSSGHLPPLVAGLALSTAIEETLRIAFFGGYAAPFPALGWTRHLSASNLDLFVIAVAAVVGLAYEVSLRFTRIGRALRATADNVEMARLLGWNAERIRALAFVLGAALAGFAGVLVAIIYQSISFDFGVSLEFIAIACMLLGGLGSVAGALLAAIVIGVSQALVSTYVSSSYVNALVFGIVLLVIVVRPSGILGVDRGARA